MILKQHLLWNFFPELNFNFVSNELNENIFSLFLLKFFSFFVLFQLKNFKYKLK